MAMSKITWNKLGFSLALSIQGKSPISGDVIPLIQDNLKDH